MEQLKNSSLSAQQDKLFAHILVRDAWTYAKGNPVLNYRVFKYVKE